MADELRYKKLTAKDGLLPLPGDAAQRDSEFQRLPLPGMPKATQPTEAPRDEPRQAEPTAQPASRDDSDLIERMSAAIARLEQLEREKAVSRETPGIDSPSPTVAAGGPVALGSADPPTTTTAPQTPGSDDSGLARRIEGIEKAVDELKSMLRTAVEDTTTIRRTLESGDFGIAIIG